MTTVEQKPKAPAAEAGGKGEQLSKLQAEVCGHLCDFYLERPPGASFEFRQEVDKCLSHISVESLTSEAAVAFQFKAAVKAINNLPVLSNEPVPKGHKKIPRDESIIAAEKAYKLFALERLTKITDHYAQAHKPGDKRGSLLVDAPTYADKGLHITLSAAARTSTPEFIALLNKELSPAGSFPRWNAHNLGYALHLLSVPNHHGWASLPERASIGVHFAERLSKRIERIDTDTAHNLLAHLGQLRYGVGELVKSSKDAVLFDALTQLVQRCPTEVKESSLAMGAHELSSFLPDGLSPEGRDAYLGLHAALTKRAEQSIAPLRQNSVGSFFYGLVNVNSSSLSPQAKASLLSSLTCMTKSLEECDEPLNEKTITSVCSGLKNIDPADLGPSGIHLVTRITRCLHHNIAEFSSCLNTQAFSAINFSSLTKTNSSDPDLRLATRNLMKLSLEKVSYNTSSITDLGSLADCARTLYPSRHAFEPEIQRIFKIMGTFATPKAPPFYDNEGNYPSREQLMTAQAVISQAYALYDQRENADVARTLHTLHPLAQDNARYHRSESERRITTIVTRMLDCPPDLSTILSGFEMDIVVPTTNGPVNIEVDGIHHNCPTQRILDAQRDTFLEKAGITVIRVAWNASQEELYNKVGHLQVADKRGAPVRPR